MALASGSLLAASAQQPTDVAAGSNAHETPAAPALAAAGNGGRSNTGNAPPRPEGNPLHTTETQAAGGNAPPGPESNPGNAGENQGGGGNAPPGPENNPGNAENSNGNGPGNGGNGEPGNPDKVTLCHATGSETNPYVEITIDSHAVPAHERHQDLEDIIPAPAGGCPGGQGGGEDGGEDGDGEPKKVEICHATGSETKPYEVIEIAESALAAHLREHADDLYPVPAEGCPSEGDDGEGGGNEPDKVEICHATGSETKPYEVITISESALEAHLAHGDIHPVPADGCSADNGGGGGGEQEQIPPLNQLPTVTPTTTTFVPPLQATTTEVPVVPPLAAARADQVAVLGDTARGGKLPARAGAEENAAQGGDRADGGEIPAAARATTSLPERVAEELPFTGLEALFLAALGVLTLVAGAAVRRVVDGRAS